MRIVAGDGLRRREMTGRQRVAVVTEAVRAVLLRQRAGARSAASSTATSAIIGVVADARYNTFRDAPARAMFLPFTQAPPRPTMTFIVRPAGDQRQAIEAVVAGHPQRTTRG